MILALSGLEPVGPCRTGTSPTSHRGNSRSRSGRRTSPPSPRRRSCSGRRRAPRSRRGRPSARSGRYSTDHLVDVTGPLDGLGLQRTRSPRATKRRHQRQDHEQREPSHRGGPCCRSPAGEDELPEGTPADRRTVAPGGPPRRNICPPRTAPGCSRASPAAGRPSGEYVDREDVLVVGTDEAGSLASLSVWRRIAPSTRCRLVIVGRTAWTASAAFGAELGSRRIWRATRGSARIVIRDWQPCTATTGRRGGAVMYASPSGSWAGATPGRGLAWAQPPAASRRVAVSGSYKGTDDVAASAESQSGRARPGDRGCGSACGRFSLCGARIR